MRMNFLLLLGLKELYKHWNLSISSCICCSDENIPVCAAMTGHEMLFFKISDTAYNGETFKECLLAIKQKCNLLNLTNPKFVLDNARIHHYQGMADSLLENDINLIFLPPYFPFLNPIEQIFSI
ncbi:hypothetical protein CDIK_1182 [Cucumispora dikerogammari]|nr:hypothetical protein CDIK_1182 [Cucumispora dikerogammari]